MIVYKLIFILFNNLVGKYILFYNNNLGSNLLKYFISIESKYIYINYYRKYQ